MEAIDSKTEDFNLNIINENIVFYINYLKQLFDKEGNTILNKVCELIISEISLKSWISAEECKHNEIYVFLYYLYRKMMFLMHYLQQNIQIIYMILFIVK